MFEKFKRSLKGKKVDSDRHDHVASAQPGDPSHQQLAPTSPSAPALYSAPNATSTFGKVEAASLPSKPATHRSGDTKDEPLGLRVLYQPQDTQRSIDIVFVHGLGGSSRLSWSWNRDLSFFWPQEWLPFEPELKDARILSFGYNACFMSPSSSTFNITEFAKDLLVQIKFGSDENVKPLDMGKVPIMFIVHSMGGLVFKKAYILGYNDPQYQTILNTVCCVVFLATPHRGSTLASILNKFLLVSFRSPKYYVTDLQQNSARIGDINEEFRHHAHRLQIVSFFETLPSSLGPKKMIVVEKDSAVLGYPNEISSPLNADHHTVCKYSSKEDANYNSVRNVIQSMAAKFKLKSLKRRPSSIQSRISSQSALDRLIDFAEHYREDFEILSERIVPGSCEWVHTDASYTEWWRDQCQGPSVLHMTGLPGAGKSVLASYLIQHLESTGQLVQFFFFRYDDQSKISVRNCLLSLAYQMARSLPEYRRRLQALLEEKKAMTQSDARTIWQKAIHGILSRIRISEPLFWIVDAVDESESAQVLLNLLPSLQQIGANVQVVITSRPHTVERHFDRLKTGSFGRHIYQGSMEIPEASLQMFIRQELEYTPWAEDFKQKVANTALQKSNGNFLWLHLVVKELQECDTAADVEHALSETPFELAQLYTRMECTMSKDLKHSELRLAKAILTWTTCSKRQLSLDELSEALKPAHSVLNLRHTIGRLCGDFVVVSGKNIVSMIHHSAKEFFIQHQGMALSIDQTDASQALFAKCLDILTDSKFRIWLKSQGCIGLLRYASVFWANHLAETGGKLDQVQLNKLVTFLRTPAVLGWMNAVGLTGNLRVLTSTAKHLTTFTERCRQVEADGSPLTRSPEELELVGSWANELVRVVGKFGLHLISHPRAIYTLIPHFSPPNSVMARQFATPSALSPQIHGISNPNWDDSLAKFIVGGDEWQPTNILASPDDDYFAVVSSNSTINVYYALTFQEAHKFDHSEVIVATNFNQEGDKLVTCGSRTVKVWEVSSGRLLYSVPNPTNLRATAACFDKDSSKITICCDDSQLRYHAFTKAADSHTEGWTMIDRDPRDDPSAGHGTPICSVFSPDGTQVAVSFRGTPLIVWSAESGRLIGTSERVVEKMKSRHEIWCYAQRLSWNPVTGHVMGIYNEGTLFKWYPLDTETEEPKTPILATEVVCSPNGSFFVTASGNGSLRVWNFDNFHLLYHLSCMSPVTDIAVSTNGRRIYDLRESSCNVWEPNSLIRMAEADEKASETSSSHAGSSANISLVSEASAVILEPVTALAASKTEPSFCFCNDAGLLKFSLDDGASNIEVACGYMGISALAWSGDNRLVAVAEIGGKITVRQIEATRNGRILRTVFQARSENTVWEQLFFDSRNTSLVAVSCRTTTKWHLRTNSSTTMGLHSVGDERSKWLLHPFSQDYLVAIGSATVSVHALSSLDLVATWDLDLGIPAEPTLLDSETKSSEYLSGANPDNLGGLSSSIDKVLVSPSNTEIIIQASTRTMEGRKAIYFSMVDTSFLAQSDSWNSPADSKISLPTVVTQPLPQRLLDLMKVPIGFIGHTSIADRTPQQASSSLAFIDCNFWVCTWDLDDANGEHIRRFFFLPRDWINADCLEMAQATPDGRFLCPRNGEVVIVKNGFSQNWVD